MERRNRRRVEISIDKELLERVSRVLNLPMEERLAQMTPEGRTAYLRPVEEMRPLIAAVRESERIGQDYNIRVY